MDEKRFETVDEYLASQPGPIRTILKKVRSTIRKAAPHAEEAIRYNMPAYLLEGNLVYFAAHQKHFGLYPAPRSVAGFKERLAKYGGGKATVQFPYDEPVPYDLIDEIVRFRAEGNLARAALKRKATSAVRKAAPGGRKYGKRTDN